MLRLLGINLSQVEAMLVHFGLKVCYDTAFCACDGPFWGHMGSCTDPSEPSASGRKLGDGPEPR